jgi:hypothetical protein
MARGVLKADGLEEVEVVHHRRGCGLLLALPVNGSESFGAQGGMRKKAFLPVGVERSWSELVIVRPLVFVEKFSRLKRDWPASTCVTRGETAYIAELVAGKGLLAFISGAKLSRQLPLNVDGQ